MKHDTPAGVRFVASILVLVATFLLLPGHMPIGARFLIGWNTAVVAFLAIVAVSIAGVDPSQIRAHSQRVGSSRFRVLAGVLLICLASLIAVVLVLYNVKKQEQGFQLQMLLCVATVFTAWLLLQTMFALFYARFYYQPKDGGDVVGGLRFVSDDPPDYWDFLYFSCVIGACYSTSDTDIVSRALRRAVLVQSLVSFVFYTVLIGLLMNAIATLF